MTDNLDAPVLTPPRVSLLSSANIVPVPLATGEDPNKPRRWESGFHVWTEGCEVAYLYPVCPDPDEDPKGSDGQGEEVLYQPYVIYAADACTTFAARRDFWGRATRKLIVAESTKLERELWLGEAGGNPFLSDAPTTIAGSFTPWGGIAALDQAIGNASAGRGMIHVRPALLTYLLDHFAIRREGNVYLSPMDNIVVPGRGYPGTGPANEAVGATEWMYGNTGVVEVRHSEIIFNPPQPDDYSQYRWDTNDREVRAERVSHVALDPTCATFAVQVTAADHVDA